MKRITTTQQRRHRHHTKARIAALPRLIVFRSNKAIYAQVMDDSSGKIICGTHNLKSKSGIEGAKEVGKNIAKSAKEKKVSQVVFDRNGYNYHGQIKALAEAAREGGLQF